MSVRRWTDRAVSMLVVVALVASGLMAVSVVSGVGVAPAAAAPAPVSVVPTTVTLEADRTTFAVGEVVTLTATPDVDVTVSSSYTVVVKDETTGVVLGSCGSSSTGGAVWSSSAGTCTDTLSFATGGAHTVRAHAAADTSLSGTRATSNDVMVERAAWTVSLAADRTVFAAGEKVTLTARVNQDIRASTYWVVIHDVTTGKTVGSCDRLAASSWSDEDYTCTVQAHFNSGDPHAYRAYVAYMALFMSSSRGDRVRAY